MRKRIQWETERKRMEGKFQRHLGLTLIELLVVIGIIAVLAGILWVVFLSARQSAKKVSCVSNLKQIGMAIQMYREDWGGLDPEKGVPRQYWELGLPPGKKHTLVLMGYIKDRQILFCPNWFSSPPYLDLLPEERDKIFTSYFSRYGPDHGYPGHRPFSWRIAQMPDYPIEQCILHDPAFFARDLRQIKRLLGLTVTGEVKWYDYPSVRKLELW